MAPAEQSVKYSVYTASDADEMTRLLGEVFADRDPPAVAVGLTPSEFEAFVRLFCTQAAAEGLTIVSLPDQPDRWGHRSMGSTIV